MKKFNVIESNPGSTCRCDADDDDDNSLKRMINKYCKITPITMTSNVYEVYLNQNIDECHYYNDFISLLRNANKNDIVRVFINNGGGYLYTTMQIVNAIQNSNATVIAYIEGICYSAGSMIFLACSSHALPDHCQMMCHYYSGGIEGKGNEIEKQAQHDNKFYKNFFRKLYNHFMTPEEIEQMINGEDFWFDSREIGKRLRNKMAIIQKEKKLMIKKIAQKLKTDEKTVKKAISQRNQA